MKIIWSDIANRHLNSVAAYVEENFGSMTVAKTLEKIDKKVNALAKFPESGVLDRKYSTSEYTYII